ncbi:hypothetical protein C8R43DRAFT_892320 [Mycena crocata]|nr:hypothetical protein C8R43DRAFT_892320 [Mycena crocata]
MPKPIEKKLEKRVRNFLWAEKTRVTVNQETVYAPAEQGGKNLLDIVARNEAIAITWLKTYLNFGPRRPLWCFVADEILSINALSKDKDTVAEGMRRNAYLQSWSPRTSPASIGKDLSRMVKIGKTYGIDMDAMAVSREIQGSMPVWYHRKSYASKSLYNQGVEVVTCLQISHGIRTVSDAVQLGAKMDAPRHKKLDRCKCETCTEVRETTGCRYPHSCYVKARALLDALHAKWDPRRPQPEDYEAAQAPRALQDDESIEFDPTITTHGTIADTFRIFTKGCLRNLTGAVPATKHDQDTVNEDMSVYTDGSAINNGKNNAQAGAGVYFGDNDPRNMAIHIPNDVGCTNNVGEMVAIKSAADECLHLEIGF